MMEVVLSDGGSWGSSPEVFGGFSRSSVSAESCQ